MEEDFPFSRNGNQMVSYLKVEVVSGGEQGEQEEQLGGEEEASWALGAENLFAAAVLLVEHQ